MPDDTYTYQQENDLRESFQDEESLPTFNNTQPVLVPVEQSII